MIFAKDKTSSKFTVMYCQNIFYFSIGVCEKEEEKETFWRVYCNRTKSKLSFSPKIQCIVFVLVFGIHSPIPIYELSSSSFFSFLIFLSVNTRMKWRYWFELVLQNVQTSQSISIVVHFKESFRFFYRMQRIFDES